MSSVNNITKDDGGGTNSNTNYVPVQDDVNEVKIRITDNHYCCCCNQSTIPFLKQQTYDKPKDLDHELYQDFINDMIAYNYGTDNLRSNRFTVYLITWGLIRLIINDNVYYFTNDIIDPLITEFISISITILLGTLIIQYRYKYIIKQFVYGLIDSWRPLFEENGYSIDLKQDGNGDWYTHIYKSNNNPNHNIITPLEEDVKFSIISYFAIFPTYNKQIRPILNYSQTTSNNNNIVRPPQLHTLNDKNLIINFLKDLSTNVYTLKRKLIWLLYGIWCIIIILYFMFVLHNLLLVLFLSIIIELFIEVIFYYILSTNIIPNLIVKYQNQFYDNGFTMSHNEQQQQQWWKLWKEYYIRIHRTSRINNNADILQQA